MDSSQILTITVFVIVITIVGTIALAVVGYLAFRLRDRKHPSEPGLEQGMSKPYFFERVRLPGTGDQGDDGNADRAGAADTPALPASGATGTDASPDVRPSQDADPSPADETEAAEDVPAEEPSDR